MSDRDTCRDVDLTTARVCTRGSGHPGNHVDEPEGSEW